MKKLPQSVLDFDQYLNEPPCRDEPMMVREYRHVAYKKWMVVLSDVEKLLRENAERSNV